MAGETKDWFVRGEDGKVYGPAALASLVDWAREGRIDPASYVSQDRRAWTPSQLLPDLEMKWLVETEPGKIFGPFNRELVKRLVAEGSVPKTANMYRLHELPIDCDPPPQVVEKVVERVVEKIVEKVVEVPVEKIVEKIVEVEPPARTTLVVPEVVEVIDTPPPRKVASGIFKGADRDRLAALEDAARRELSSAGRHGLKSFFGGRK